jgi:hypothetical protein
MRINKKIAISESGFVFNPTRGDSFSTNPIGLEIVNMLKAGKSREEIREYILQTYQTNEATFEKDFYDFVQQLKQHNLIDE